MNTIQKEELWKQMRADHARWKEEWIAEGCGVSYYEFLLAKVERALKEYALSKENTYRLLHERD